MNVFLMKQNAPRESPCEGFEQLQEENEVQMQEKTLLEQLYVKVFGLCASFAVYRKNIMNEIRAIFPEIRCIAEEILHTADLGLNQEEDRFVRQLLIDTLEDLVQAMTYQDEVLLEDTVEYGLKELLELFISDENRLQELREESRHE